MKHGPFSKRFCFSLWNVTLYCIYLLFLLKIGLNKIHQKKFKISKHLVMFSTIPNMYTFVVTALRVCPLNARISFHNNMLSSRDPAPQILHTLFSWICKTATKTGSKNGVRSLNSGFSALWRVKLRRKKKCQKHTQVMYFLVISCELVKT